MEAFLPIYVATIDLFRYIGFFIVVFTVYHAISFSNKRASP